MKKGLWTLLATALLALPAAARAQSLSYTSGQNVAPAYEGWEVDADGTRYFLFGYMNRNWEEELDIPSGPDNGFTPLGPDLGQPTHFLPRRNRFVFRVKVPANFTAKDELVWSITSNGKTEKAWATLRDDYKIDDVVKASETGALGAGSSSPEIRANTPPLVTVEGPAERTAKVGQPLTLVAIVTDDGVPKRRGARAGASVSGNTEPSGESGAASTADAQRLQRAMLAPPVRITVGKNVGLHLSWFVYRGKGEVSFEPPQVKPWEDTRAGANSPWAPIRSPPPMPSDGRITTEITFADPGTYLLRALADDGALTGGANVTVVVTR